MFLGGLCAPAALMANGETENTRAVATKNLLNGDPELMYGIDRIPIFCAHEHWGSIAAIGSAPEQNGYRSDTISGARPLKPVSIWDIVLDPYAASWMRSAGRDPNEAAAASGFTSQKEWFAKDPRRALEKFKTLVHPLVLTGVFQSTRRGIQHLYGMDIAKFETDDWVKADLQIRDNYAEIFSWYRSAMTKANFSNLVRPVHPEYYFKKESDQSAKEEASFTRTVLRIDPFLDLWKPNDKRREALSGLAGIEPADASSFRKFIGRMFDVAGENNAVGIKQLQAYFRSFNFLERKDSEVVFRGDLTPEQIIVFQDWVMHECCRQANERNWIHQVHVGTHNLEHSSPLPLENLSRKYGRMKIVMIHCWPFIKEAGWLAKMRPNMYIDANWLNVLNPAFLNEALNTWMGYVPSHKLMLSNDSTHVEMATGSSLFTREIVSERLYAQNKVLKLPVDILRKISADLLNNNAVQLYGFGKEV